MKHSSQLLSSSLQISSLSFFPCSAVPQPPRGESSRALLRSPGSDWLGAGITLSVVHPSITAAEFHERLRAGSPGERASHLARPAQTRKQSSVRLSIGDEEEH